METVVCPQCGNVNPAGTIRCPRCNKLLLTPCSGACSQCKHKQACGHK